MGEAAGTGTGWICDRVSVGIRVTGMDLGQVTKNANQYVFVCLDGRPPCYMVDGKVLGGLVRFPATRLFSVQIGCPPGMTMMPGHQRRPGGLRRDYCCWCSAADSHLSGLEHRGIDCGYLLGLIGQTNWAKP